MVLSVIGLCAFFSFLGIFAFAGPVAGKFYLGGDLKAASIISESTGISNPAALLSAAFLSYLRFLGQFSSRSPFGDPASSRNGLLSLMLFPLP